VIHLASIRELVFVIDGSEAEYHCITLMISLIYGKRALPITWLIVESCKGYLPENLFYSSNCERSCPEIIKRSISEIVNLMELNSKLLCSLWVWLCLSYRQEHPAFRKRFAIFV
jgi:hypothetical protein